MAYFGLLHRSYDTEVICIYVMEPVFYCLLLLIVLCDLYFDGHILLCWCITLIYSFFMLLVLNVYMWESIMNIPSLLTSHFSCCSCESTLSLCTPISILLLCYWPHTYNCSCCISLWLWSIGSWHTWHFRHTYYWLSAFFIKSCNRTIWETL